MRLYNDINLAIKQLPITNISTAPFRVSIKQNSRGAKKNNRGGSVFLSTSPIRALIPLKYVSLNKVLWDFVTRRQFTLPDYI